MKFFKSKFSEPEASAIIEYIEKQAEEKIIHKKDIFLSKDDKVEIVSMIKDTKAEIIKWMFIFWIGQIAALIGIIAVFLK
jgi:hypothetical protein